MKIKLILIAILCAGITGNVCAQTQKGNQLLGGLINFNSSKTSSKYNSSYGSSYSYDDAAKNTSFTVGANYSVFVADNLDLGLSAGYATSKLNAPNNSQISRNKTNGFFGAVSLRKYFLYNNKIGVRTGPFVQYQYNKSDVDYNFVYYTGSGSYSSISNAAQKSNVLAAGLGLDLVYFPIRRLGFAAGIGSLSYTHQSNSDLNNTYKDKINSFGLNLATSALTVSVFYGFGK